MPSCSGHKGAHYPYFSTVRPQELAQQRQQRILLVAASPM